MRRLVDKVRGALRGGTTPPAAVAAPVATPGGKPELLLLGHSHAYAIWRGFHAASFPFELRFFDLLATGVAEAIAATEDGVVPPLLDFVRAHPDAPVLLSYGGNEHNLLALVEPPEPFDFQLPGAAAPDARRWIIPAGAMRANLAGYVARLGQLMRGFRAAFPERRAWLLLPPPPIPDAEHIAAHPVVFAEKIAESGIAPYAVRHKVWRLQCDLMREMAADAALDVFGVPATTLDGEGRLRREAWGQDAVHASVWYGEQLLHSLAPQVLARPEPAR